MGAADHWKAENLKGQVALKIALLNTADLNPANAPVHFPLAVPNAHAQHGHLLGTYCACPASLPFKLLQLHALPPPVSGHDVGLATPLGSLLVAQYSSFYRTALVYCSLQVLGTKAFLSPQLWWS